MFSSTIIWSLVCFVVCVHSENNDDQPFCARDQADGDCLKEGDNYLKTKDAYHNKEPLDLDLSKITCGGKRNRDQGIENPIINLRKIEDQWADRDKIFFIESSDRPFLKPRQACAIESAILRAGSGGDGSGGIGGSGGGLSVVAVLTSPTLDLSDNSTCQLYRKYSERGVFFRHVDKAEVFQATPLQQVYEDGRIDQSPTPVVHYR